MEDSNNNRRQSLVKNSLPEEADKDAGEILHTMEILFRPSAVVELRAFKGRETVSGYYDDHELLAYEAGKLEVGLPRLRGLLAFKPRRLLSV
jgi:hypothetical protein